MTCGLPGRVVCPGCLANQKREPASPEDIREAMRSAYGLARRPKRLDGERRRWLVEILLDFGETIRADRELAALFQRVMHSVMMAGPK